MPLQGDTATSSYEANPCSKETGSARDEAKSTAAFLRTRIDLTGQPA